MVSLPVLNPLTGINRSFDTFELMPSHNDMAAMVDQMQFDDERPAFYMLNVGETHYPYALPHEDPKDWPRISGVHGVFKHMGDPGADAPEQFFDQEQLDALRQRQIDAVTYLDETSSRSSSTSSRRRHGSSSQPITASCSARRASSGTGRSSTRRSPRFPSSRAWPRASPSGRLRGRG